MSKICMKDGVLIKLPRWLEKLIRSLVLTSFSSSVFNLRFKVLHFVLTLDVLRFNVPGYYGENLPHLVI